MASFDIAIAKTLGHEEGYVSDPADPSGETNFGISKRSYPDVNIRELTVEQAREIYRRDYWHSLYDQLNDQHVANALFDFGVTAGVDEGIRRLQRAVGVQEDGIFGPETLAAVNNAGAPAAQFFLERIRYYAGLATFHIFAGGWVKRSLDF